MKTFVPKTPFDLTSFLNTPGKPKTHRNGGRGMGFSGRPAKPEGIAEPLAELPETAPPGDVLKEK